MIAYYKGLLMDVNARSVAGCIQNYMRYKTSLHFFAMAMPDGLFMYM